MEKTDFSCSLLAHFLISQQIEFNNQSYENDGIKQYLADYANIYHIVSL